MIARLIIGGILILVGLGMVSASIDPPNLAGLAVGGMVAVAGGIVALRRNL